MKLILTLILLNAIAIFNVMCVNGLVSSKSTEVKLKAFADKLFDNLLVSKEQYANKTRISELKTVFDKIKQNPIRLFDLMITLKNNKALSEEAMKIIDVSQFDQCIQMLIDLILQRLEYWMQSTTTSAPTGTTLSGGPTTTGPATTVSATSPGTTATGTGTTLSPTTTTTAITTATTIAGTTSTATSTATTTTVTTTPTTTTTTTTFLYTPKPILTDTVLIDPLYCNNFTINNCGLAAAGQPINLIPFICKSMCSCQGSITCANSGTPVLNSSGSCRCLCKAGYYGSSCQTTDREFCQLSLKPSCSDNFILSACPILCTS